MTREVVVLEEAEQELSAAVTWYEARRPGLGGALLDRPGYWRAR